MNCLKNVFFIIENITNDIILGTLFLIQIYPFYNVNKLGVHTQILGKQISFNLFSCYQAERGFSFAFSSIYRKVNALQSKQNQISNL